MTDVRKAYAASIALLAVLVPGVVLGVLPALGTHQDPFTMHLDATSDIGGVPVAVDLTGTIQVNDGGTKLRITDGSVEIGTGESAVTFQIQKGDGQVKDTEIKKITAKIKGENVEGELKLKGEITDTSTGAMEASGSIKVRVKSNGKPVEFAASYAGTGTASGVYHVAGPPVEGTFTAVANSTEESSATASLNLSGSLTAKASKELLKDVSGNMTINGVDYEVSGKGKLNANDGEISLDLALISDGEETGEVELKGTVTGVSPGAIAGTFNLSLQGDVKLEDAEEEEASLTLVGSITITL